MIALYYERHIGPEAECEPLLECATCPAECYSLSEDGRCDRCVSGATERDKHAEIEAEFWEGEF
jgi:ferredoxin-like protein FixX